MLGFFIAVLCVGWEIRLREKFEQHSFDKMSSKNHATRTHNLRFYGLLDTYLIYFRMALSSQNPLPTPYNGNHRWLLLDEELCFLAWHKYLLGYGSAISDDVYFDTLTPLPYHAFMRIIRLKYYFPYPLKYVTVFLTIHVADFVLKTGRKFDVYCITKSFTPPPLRVWRHFWTINNGHSMTGRI